MRGIGLLGVGALLTACPGTYTPPPPGQAVTFTLPAGAPGDLKINFLWQDATGGAHVVGYGYAGYGNSSNTLYLGGYEIADLLKNDQFLTPFVGGETKEKTNVQVSVPSVKTGNLYPIAWRDLDGNGTPVESEIVYDSHDLLSYASEAFTYSFGFASTGKSTESGARTQGWSHVRHVVLEPSDAPGTYKITMNSVTDPTVRLHEPSDYLTSQSVGGQP